MVFLNFSTYDYVNKDENLGTRFKETEAVGVQEDCP